MQQTEKYKFSIIDTSDTFSPDVLNDNARAVETELARVETESAAEAAAIRAEFAAADTKLSQTAAADKAELQATIAAVEKGASLVHLAGPYENGVAVDFSGIDLSQYRALMLLVRVSGNYGVVYCNDIYVVNLSTGGEAVWFINAGGKVFSSNGGSSNYEVKWSNITKFTFTHVNYADIYALKA